MLQNQTSIVQSQFETLGLTQQTKSTNALLYKVIPGLGDTQMTLQQLLEKPFQVANYVMDASRYIFAIPVTASFFDQNPFAVLLRKIYLTCYFNVRFHVHIPGHQFAVALVGAAYDPSFSLTPRLTPNLPDVPNGPTRGDEYFNFIQNLDGQFVHVSDSSQIMTVDAILPRNTTYNNLVDINSTTSVYDELGWLRILSVFTPKFSMDINKLDIRIFAELTDVKLRPFNNAR